MTQVVRILCWVAGLFFFLSSVLPTASSASTIGRELVNVASIEYQQNGDRIKTTAGPAKFTIQPRRTPSKIEFFRIAVNAPDGWDVDLNGSDYSPSGSLEGPFFEIEVSDDLFSKYAKPGTAIKSKAGQVNVRLIEAKTYRSGDLVIVAVTDPGQNGDPTQIETIAAEVEVVEGDKAVVLLYESDVNSGIFFAYIPTSAEPTPVFDPQLTIKNDKKIGAVYVDRFDVQETSTTTALLNSSGQVIESFTGKAVSGIRVSLINSATGEPAKVFGPNGNSIYPSTVISGEAVTDSLGVTYEQGQGEFDFPLVSPGRYHFEVDADESYRFPSLIEDFSGITIDESTITQASYGETFEITTTAPVSFTLPLDTATDLVLRKETATSIAAIGDFVPYTIKIENRGEQPTPILIRDVAPAGFRLKTSSVKSDNGTVSVFSKDGQTYEFRTSTLGVNESLNLSYVMEVGAGTQTGDALNTAFLLNSRGEKISNAAESTVFIQEDLLRSRGTIVGLIREAQCDRPQPKKAPVIGVAGVRLYMETGAYVISDARGQFHFENLKSGTHVVQIDPLSIPAGYTAETCDGKPLDKSQFVDLSGGTIWRADFALRKTGATLPIETAETKLSDTQEYLKYDQVWLDQQDSETSWAYPKATDTPAASSIHLGIKHKASQRIELYLNGSATASKNGSGRILASHKKTALSRYRGVDIQKGENVFLVKVLNNDGSVAETFERKIWYVSEALRAAYSPENSNLKADGQTAPTIAVKITDGSGRAVHAGRVISVDVEAPYQLQLANALERQSGVSESLAARGGVSISQGGLAKITLEPTLTTGYVSVRIKMDDDRVEIIRAYLSPQSRDWLVVGMAEGRAGSRSGKTSDTSNPFEDVFGDGRVAVYAKGTVLKDWLLTVGIDTDRTKKFDNSDGFVQEINPNSGYLIYGDQSYQQIDAQSRYPFYARLEKDGIQALFGDFQTDLNTTELSRYSRRLSGVKFIADQDNLSINLFASETNQGFNKDELAADGTSGPYQLSAFPVLEQSETITLEIRDRLRSDEILQTRTLIRYFDYELNSRTGEIIFREPVNVTDSALNPQVIVVDYETGIDAETNLTYGGRGAIKFNQGRAEIGASVISEEGASTGPNAKSNLVGVDATYAPNENIRIKAEYAESETSGDTGKTKGRAILVEGDFQTEKTSINAYFREENTGFGLGQQNSATENIRRYGARATHQLSQVDDAETQLRRTVSVEGEAYSEENLTTGKSRQVVETLVTRKSQTLGLEAGLKYVKEDLVNAENRESMLVVSGAQKTFKEAGLAIFARHEQPVFGKNESSNFPQRTLLGADKTISDRVTLNVRHEILNGDNASGQNTAFGATVRPWTGADVRTSVDHTLNDSRRLGATIGVDQNIAINDIWTASLGGARRAIISATDQVEPIVSDVANNPIAASPVSALTGTDGYTSLYAGLARTTDIMSISGRGELRDSQAEQRYTASLAAARQIRTDLSFAGAARYQHLNQKDTGLDSNAGSLSLGLAYRPRENAPVIFDRFDFTFQKGIDGTKTQKLINNFALNADLFDKVQSSLFLGTKFTQTTIGLETYESWTHLVGGEQRYQINKTFDVGVTASALYSSGPGTVEYAFGPSVGVSPTKDIWVSAGWNITGFKDKDFEAAEYTQQGPFITMRLKFDQDSARGLMDRLRKYKS